MTHHALTPCPVCGGTTGAVVTTRDGKTREPLMVLQCDTCGLGRLDPMPTPEALADWYRSRYRQAYKAAVRPRMTHVLRAARLARERWTWAAAQPGGVCRGRSLDVGASSGEFVDLMRSVGMQAEGLEPHEGYCAHARDVLGLRMTSGTVPASLSQFQGGAYELVSLFHVLEHLTDPVNALRALARLLSPEGRLLMEVPDASWFSSPDNMFFRAHTLYFTAHSLQTTVREAGLAVVASQFGETGNLRVLLQPLPQRQAGVPEVGLVPAPQAARWTPSDALMAGQRARSWPRYLVRRLAEGYLWRRWLARREESATARRYETPRSLLDGVYAGVALPRAGAAHPPHN